MRVKSQMKKMLTLFALILAIGLGHHRRGQETGGGKSFGKSYKTAPAQLRGKPVEPRT